MNAVLNLKGIIGTPVREYEFAFPSENFETEEEYFDAIIAILDANGLAFGVSVHADCIDFYSEPQQGTDGNEYSITARLTGDADTLAHFRKGEGF